MIPFLKLPVEALRRIWARKPFVKNGPWITNVRQAHIHEDGFGADCGNAAGAICVTCSKRMPRIWNTVCACCGDTSCYEHSHVRNAHWFCQKHSIDGDPVLILSQPEPENSHNQDRTAGLAAGSVLGTVAGKEEISALSKKFPLRFEFPYVCPSCAQPSSCRPQDHPGSYLCENPQCQVFLFLPSPRA